jgi:hypothetical protein
MFEFQIESQIHKGSILINLWFMFRKMLQAAPTTAKAPVYLHRQLIMQGKQYQALLLIIILRL